MEAWGRLASWGLVLLLAMGLGCTVEGGKVGAGLGAGDAKDSLVPVGWMLIRDNLYMDPAGTLYLRSENHEDLDAGRTYPEWLKTVYCDSCWTATKRGWTDITELKDLVDTGSFHHVVADSVAGGDVYMDKRYRYFHKWMADGGTLTLVGK